MKNEARKALWIVAVLLGGILPSLPYEVQGQPSLNRDLSIAQNMTFYSDPSARSLPLIFAKRGQTLWIPIFANRSDTSGGDLTVGLVIESNPSLNPTCTYLTWYGSSRTASIIASFVVPAGAAPANYTITASINTYNRDEAQNKGCPPSYNPPTYSEANVLGQQDKTNNVVSRKITIGKSSDFLISGGVEWCSGFPSAGSCTPLRNALNLTSAERTNRRCPESGSNPAYNITYYNSTYKSTCPADPKFQYTYFRINVSNIGDPYLDPNTGSHGRYQIRWKLFLNSTPKKPVFDLAPRYDKVGLIASPAFDLVGAGGDYTLQVTVDPFNETLDKNPSNNTVFFYPKVLGADLSPYVYLSDFKKGLSLSNPIPSNAPYILRFNVSLRNLGSLPVPTDEVGITGIANNIALGIYVDSISDLKSNVTAARDESGNRQIQFIRPTDLAAGANKTYEFRWKVSVDPNEPHSLSRTGKHNLYIVADVPPDSTRSRGKVLEGDEVNNVVNLTIYVEDRVPPTISNVVIHRVPPDPENENETGPGSCLCLWVRPDSPFNITAVVTDTSAVTGVRVVFRYPNGTTTPLGNFSMSKFSGNTYRKIFTGKEEFFRPDPSKDHIYGVYSFRIEALDDSGNWGHSPPVRMAIRPWSKATRVLLPSEPGKVFDWNPDGVSVVFRIVVNNTNDTGLSPYNTTAGKTLYVLPPRLRSPVALPFADAWRCHGSGLPFDPRVCSSPDTYETTYTTGTDPSTAIGRYTAWINVSDVVGEVRRTWWNFSIFDALPTLEKVEAPAILDARVPFRINVTASDDLGIRSVRLNFTLPSRPGWYWNVSLEGPAGTPKSGTWESTFPTGRGTNLSRQGVYTYSLGIEDVSGNWRVVQRELEIRDDRNPPALLVSVRPTPPFQLGENITFEARVNDDTDVRVELFLLNGSTPFLRANMTEDRRNPGNFSYSWGCTEPGSFSFRIVATDSGGFQRVEPDRPFSCLPNLPPRTIWTPGRLEGVTILGENYIGRSPTLHFSTFDTKDGVNESELQVRVNGEIVLFDKTRDPLNNGFRITVPPSSLRAPLSHNSTILVAIRSGDLSPERLSNTTTFLFHVDARPPETRLGPSFPIYVSEGTTWVSLSTRFHLNATDNDGLPTGVDSTWYEVLRQSASPLQRYTPEGFTLRDVPGIYTGPGQYLIRFNSTDEVGNVESRGVAGKTVVSVMLDETPPHEVPLESDHQGRYVNLTVRDGEETGSGSGVKNATIFYRVHRGPEQRLPMRLEGGKWRAVLPEGRRGDNVTYYVELRDNVDNVGYSGSPTRPFFFLVGNHPPKLLVLSPAPNSTVRDILRVRFQVFDEDPGDLVTVSVFASPARSESARLLGNVSGVDHLDVDTRTLEDGPWSIVVVASDGSSATRVSVPIVVSNAGPAIVNPKTSSSRVRPGEAVLVTAYIAKPDVLSVRALLYDGTGSLVGTYPMADNGTDGDLRAGDRIYTARIVPPKKGSFSVTIVVQYQEGGEIKESETPRGSVTFAVESSAWDLFEAQGTLWGILLVLFAGVVLVALLVSRRWRGGG